MPAPVVVPPRRSTALARAIVAVVAVPAVGTTEARSTVPIMVPLTTRNTTTEMNPVTIKAILPVRGMVERSIAVTDTATRKARNRQQYPRR